MKEFIKLNKYGLLYMDKILFESYFPIIFTCINDTKDIFICVCCQNNENGCKWLLGKTDGSSIVKMLRDEITIRQLLLEYSIEKISVSYVENEYAIDYNSADWNEDSSYLPKEDSYMYAEEGEFEEEISYFSSINDCVPYNMESYQPIAEISGTINSGIESATEILAAFTSPIGTISIPSEIVSTLKVTGKLQIEFAMNTENYSDQGKYESVYNKTFNVISQDLSIKVESADNHYCADAA